MVSSFSNPGFPPVDVHPTRLPAMDARLSAAIDSFEASMRAALRDAIREALDSAFANFTTNFSRDWALLRRDSALKAEGVSDPVPTTSDDTQSIDLGHTGLQGDDNPPRLPSPVQVHSVPPLLSSSPLLRALATPVVKPQSIDSVAAIVSLLGSKTVIPDSVMTTASQLLPDCSASMFSNLCKFSGNEFTTPTFFRKKGADFMKAQPSMIAHKCQQGLVGMYARYVFDEIPDSCCCVVLDRDMCYCKGIQDKGGGSKFRSPDECRRKLEEKIAKSDYDVSIGCFITKKLHVWCQLPRVLWIRRHEVLRSLIYNLSHREAKWYWFLLFILAYYTGVIVILYEDSLTEKCGWVNWYLVGKFVKKNFYALQLFDRLSKRGSANVHVLYVASLDMHDLEANPKLDGSSSKPRVKEVSSAENDNVSHIEIKIIEYHGSDEKCVLRYLNLSDNAMGNYGVNAFESLLSSQNNLRELYLMNMARLNMCHNTREWHCDAIRKIKWPNENEISVMINTEGQANYEGFSDCIKYGEELTFKLLLYFQAVKAKSLGFTKLGSPDEAKKVVGNMNDVTASAKQLKEMEQGLTSLIVLRNGRLSDLIAQLQDILEGVNEADILPEKFDNAVIKAQIPQWAREIRELTSSRPVTIYNENSSSSGNYASYLVPLAALAAMGYCYMWWRDWSFSDVMYVTRHNMANVVEALIREVASKSNDFAGNGTTNALKMSECAMGTYLDLVCSLSHLESNFGGALVIDLHVEFSLFFTCNLDYRLLWDPGDAMAKTVKMILYFNNVKAKWLNRVTRITKFGSFMVQLDRSVEALNKGKKQKTRDGGYSDEMKSLHDLSVNKAVDMATRFDSALLLMIGKSLLSSSNKTQEANVDVVLGAGDLSLLVENNSVEQLGFVRKVTIFKDSTSIIGDAASKDGLQVHGVSPFDIMGRTLFWEKQLQGLQMGAITRKFMVVNFSSGFDESSYLSRVENFEKVSQENYGEATGNKNSLTQFKRAAIPGRIIMISKSSSTIPFLSLEDKANFQGGSIVMTQIITEVLCFITVRNC